MNRQIAIYMHFITLPGNPPLVRAGCTERERTLPEEGAEGTEGEGGPRTSAGGGNCGCSIKDHLVEVGKTLPPPPPHLSLICFYTKLKVKFKYVY